MKERLAIFDVDGTLFEGNLGIEFVKTLVKKGVFGKEVGDGILSWYGKYKSGEVERSVAVDEIYQLFASGMTNKREDKMQSVAMETWNEIVGKLHGFTKPLVELLRERGFRIILLSGSPIEMTRILGEKLKVNELIAGVLEITDGMYTGKTIAYLGSAEQKVAAINEYISGKKLDIDWSKSFGMGNNERDLGILKQVGLSFAFEPSDILRSKSDEIKFVIVNRNNVVDSVRKSLPKSS